jgi:linoleoyl-CoA desaturase
MKEIRFRHESEQAFYRTLKSRVDGYFARTGKSRYADGLFFFKAGLFASLAVATYTLILLNPFGHWALLPLAFVFGLSALFLAANVAHDASHDAIFRNRTLNHVVQALSFVLLGVNSYLWRMRHTKSHHIFPNVNGCDIDIDENPFLRLSPNQPWRRHFRFQHLYAPLAYVCVALHTILFQDFVYLFKKELANMKDIRHPWYQYVLFALGKIVYFGIVLVVPILVIDLPWWQIVLGYFSMTALVSLAFVFLLIGTHFSEGTEFPLADADGNLEHTWAVHNLVTACDWSPSSRLAHFLVGGVNAHAAHHLFPRVCHTHYRAIAAIIEQTAAEFGIPYHQTNLSGIVRSHFAFLKQLGHKPATTLAA